MARAAGEVLTEADVLDEVGNALVGLGRYPDAIGHFHNALEICRAAGHPFEVATLQHLAGAHLAASHPGRARRNLAPGAGPGDRAG